MSNTGVTNYKNFPQSVRLQLCVRAIDNESSKLLAAEKEKRVNDVLLISYKIEILANNIANILKVR